MARSPLVNAAAAASAMAAAGTPSHCQLPIEGYLKNIIMMLYMLICYRAPPSSVVRDQLVAA